MAINNDDPLGAFDENFPGGQAFIHIHVTKEAIEYEKARKAGYEEGLKAAKEELKQAAEAVKKQMAIAKIKEFILTREGTTEEIAEHLYEKGFRIE
jgi:hypothetical protein